VEQVGLACPLVAEDGDNLGVGLGVVAIEIDDGEELLALAGIQFRHVVTGADIVVGVTGEVVAERVASLAQELHGLGGHGSFLGGWHGITSCFVVWIG
jgi:hypothetical protein